MNSFNLMNINASRCGNLGKIRDILMFLVEYNPLVVCIQEINLYAAVKIFSGQFRVYCNIENDAKDGVGIVSLVKRNIQVHDVIVGCLVKTCWSFLCWGRNCFLVVYRLFWLRSCVWLRSR